MPGKTSVSKIFEIPKFYYFDSGNDYSGSLGDFAYKVCTGEKLVCKTWHGRLCSEKAEIENQQEFDRHGVSSNADERTINEIYFATFRKAAESTPNGKTAIEDIEYNKQVKRELGIKVEDDAPAE